MKVITAVNSVCGPTRVPGVDLRNTCHCGLQFCERVHIMWHKREKEKEDTSQCVLQLSRFCPPFFSISLPWISASFSPKKLCLITTDYVPPESRIKRTMRRTIACLHPDREPGERGDVLLLIGFGSKICQMHRKNLEAAIT